MDNKNLKSKYNEMHAAGPSSWFDSGWEERKTIINMGEPWKGLNVLEIGCGEGDLYVMMEIAGALPQGIDYSKEAVKRFHYKYPERFVVQKNYQDVQNRYDRLVLQGVLEHLDDPFTELKWMIDNLLKKGGDVITSSPNFCNPRGFVWMTLALLFNVPMSLTDLHFLNVWDFGYFCEKHGYEWKYLSCNVDWGSGNDMVKDLKQRLPKALADAKMPDIGVPKLTKWLQDFANHYNLDTDMEAPMGAVTVYRIQT